MDFTKKRKDESDPSDFKRKKSKVKDSKESTKYPISTLDDYNKDELHAEQLSTEVIREGMLILGCVIDINKTYLVMSLPGCLSGRVSLNNISNECTKILESSCDTGSSESLVHTFIKVGMVVPCKVLEVSKVEGKKRPLIHLSIKPEDVNAEIKPKILYPKMVLYVTVCSVEDHGYVVDVGVENIQGFLTRQGSEDELLKIGEITPAYIRKISYSDRKNYSSAKIQLSKLDFNDNFPEVTDDIKSLSAVLPGAKIEAEVIETERTWVFMLFGSYFACACTLSLGSNYKSINVGSTITGTVLYVHPITRMIYLMLNRKPSPKLFAGYFGLKKYELVKTLKFQLFYKREIYYEIKKGTIGFINTSEMSRGWCSRDAELGKVTPISEASVYQLHFMDNLVQLSTKPELKTFIALEDVKIGDIYEATVVKHLENGMFVKIGHQLNGFIRRIFMSDFYVTKPEVLYPVGKKIKCRVIGKDNKGKLILTCKKSLVRLPEHDVLSSYKSITGRGQLWWGVIGKICKEYVLILYFNSVKGVVLPPFSQNGLFYEGETVLTSVERFNPKDNQLILRIKADAADVQRFKDSKISCSKVNLEKDTVISNQSEEIIINRKYDGNKPVEARVLNVKGSHLLVSLNKDNSDIGRVHITNVGCHTGDTYPLRDFSVGQVIQVYVIGETKKKKRNFLRVTHQNFIYTKECSLNPISELSSLCLDPGTSLIGFVKKVYDIYAELWLTPSEIGILDYLHFSENLQTVKKLPRHLKVGMSLEVSVLEDQVSSKNNKGNNNTSLTKIGMSVPEVGKNIIGLVQVANLESGLSLKLPFNYHGFAAVTDLTDIYLPAQTLFDKFQNLKYILCHVLEVNHETRTCQLSLRKSRVYGIKAGNCPEVTHQNIKEGFVAKGFVKSISDTAVTVILGKQLEGKVKIHQCETSGCTECKESKRITKKYSVGSVAKVVVLKNSVGKVPCILAFEDQRSLAENTGNDRINIDEEISWDEVE